ncbi:MAG TPA: type II TA system antitoxin MqsA family protein [Pirellulales bacterium]|jgi:putative zinc finger/helix-turn-helix YgiT family protein
MSIEFCVACGHDTDIRRETERTEYLVRGEAIAVDVTVRVCPSCGVKEIDTSLGDPVEFAFREYRTRHGLLQPEEIRQIRERCGASQLSLATLLGMSQATLNRYEGGSIQEATHDNVLRACRDANFFRDLFARRGHLLTHGQSARVERSFVTPES